LLDTDPMSGWRAAPTPIARPLALASATVAGAGLAVELVHTRSHADAVESLVALFSLSFEGNLPTWYSSSLLFTCAFALTAIARTARTHRRHWLGLAAGFFYMSLDEAIELHEHLGGLVGTGGALYFDWVIPAGIVVAAVAALYLPFLRDLPRYRRRMFVLAGLLYVGGAVAMELPLGWWTAQHGVDNAGYALIDWVEETLEIAGASLFLIALAQRWDDRAEATP
jgi:hypothetical protein